MIVITGANGFIGSAMAWELNQQGQHDLVLVDSIGLTERNLIEKRDYKKFLLKDELWDFLRSSESKKITWIVHMGACSSTTETNWEFLKENNLEYSQRIFQWCAENKKNLIYASSGATYGLGELGFSDTLDSEKLKPLNLYGDSKVMMDRWALKQKNSPLHWYGVKFFNVFGPHEYFKGSMSSVAFKAFQQIKETGKLKLFRSHNPKFKDGEQLRDFVYVKEVTRWMCELMGKPVDSGLYNMGYGQARTWIDLATAVFQSMGKPVQIDWIDIPENIRNQYQYFTEADMTKWLRAGLSQPQWKVEVAVRDYVQNYLMKENPYL